MTLSSQNVCSQTLSQIFSQMIGNGDKYYDPEWRMLKTRTYKNLHTEHLDDSFRHPIRESLDYVLLLLEREKHGDVERAKDILHKVFALQGDHDLSASESGKSDSLNGLWNYFAEESVYDWPMPDLNWADFNGMTLLMIWHLKRSLLDAETLAKMKLAISRAAHCIRRRNVHLGYTNIAIKGTFVTLSAAEVLDDAVLREYAIDRAKRLHAEIFKTASFAEYNSPTYAAVSIGGLMAIQQFVSHEPSKKLALEIQHLFWHHIASHFHVSTGELAGPHSRAYTIRLHDAPHLLGTMLLKATNGHIRYDFSRGKHDADFGAFYGYFLNPSLPQAAEKLLLNSGRVATIQEITDPRGGLGAWWRPVNPPDLRDGSLPIKNPIPAEITTHLEPTFSLGSVNLMDGWEQRQNLVAFWKNNSSAPSYLLHRYLHDDRPCCSGMFASVQKDGFVLASSFLSHYCDHHVSIVADEIDASFLGAVVDIDGESDTFDAWLGKEFLKKGIHPWQDGDYLWLRFPQVWIAMKLMAHKADPHSQTEARIIMNEHKVQLRFPHYQGERKKIKWGDFAFTHTSYALWLNKPMGDWKAWQDEVLSKSTSIVFQDGKARISAGNCVLGVPTSVVHRENLPEFVSFGK